VVDLDDVLHGRHEGCVGVWRDHPIVVQVRLENVFLRPPDGVVAGSRDDIQLDNLAFQDL
jgi:hypothetical protein